MGIKTLSCLFLIFKIPCFYCGLFQILYFMPSFRLEFLELAVNWMSLEKDVDGREGIKIQIKK